MVCSQITVRVWFPVGEIRVAVRVRVTDKTEGYGYTQGLLAVGGGVGLR